MCRVRLHSEGGANVCRVQCRVHNEQFDIEPSDRPVVVGYFLHAPFRTTPGQARTSALAALREHTVHIVEQRRYRGFK